MAKPIVPYEFITIIAEKNDFKCVNRLVVIVKQTNRRWPDTRSFANHFFACIYLKVI